ncbi:LysR family transcriptional regulator substrate-binding protein [Corynebacterium sp. 335C]
MSDESPAPLRVAFVPGVMPAKWFRRWRDRVDVPLAELPADDPVALVAAGEADMALARDPRDDDAMHAIELYREAPGVAVSRDHVAAVLPDGEVVDRAELDDDLVLLDSADPAAVREMLPVVASNAGILFAPRPLLHVLGGRAIVDREVSGDLDVRTRIALTWPKEHDDEVRQEFAGIVRGRRAGSNRGALAGEEAQEKPKRTAREKALAKQERRARAAGGKGGAGGSGGGRGGSGRGGAGRGAKGGGRGGRSGGGRGRRR